MIENPSARRAILATVSLIVLVYGSPFQSAHGAEHESDAPATPEGIDVSHHSGDVDWPTVAAAGYEFAYVKATEGVDDTDPRFEEHWKALKAHGIVRGAYHFYVTEDDPERQAKFFLSTVDHEDGDLVPVVDIELIGNGTTPGIADRLRRFLEIVESELGVRPMVYTMPNFWNENFGAGFETYPLWVAEYEVDAPRLPEGWTDWHLWQYRGDATIAGVEKNADVSRLHPGTSLDSLRLDLNR